MPLDLQVEGTASTVIAWNSSFDVDEPGRNGGVRIRKPRDMIYRFLGIETMRFNVQIEDIWRIIVGDFVKIGYTIKFS